MRKPILALLLVLAFVAQASAALTGKTVSVTDTAQTVTFGGAARVYVSGVNDGSATIVFRLYACGDTVVPVVYTDGATDAVTLKNGEPFSSDHNPRTVSGSAWCSMSVIANTGLTATLRLVFE